MRSRVARALIGSISISMARFCGARVDQLAVLEAVERLERDPHALERRERGVLHVGGGRGEGAMR